MNYMSYSVAAAKPRPLCKARHPTEKQLCVLYSNHFDDHRCINPRFRGKKDEPAWPMLIRMRIRLTHPTTMARIGDMNDWMPTAGQRAWIDYLEQNGDVLRLYRTTATVRVACGGLREGQWMTIRGVRLSALSRPKRYTEIRDLRAAKEAQ